MSSISGSSRRAILTGIATALAAGSAATASAHEKWYFPGHGDYPLRPSDLLETPSLALISLVVAATIAAGWWQYRRGGRDLLPGPERFGATFAGRARLYGLVPAILGIHLAVPLLVQGSTGKLFTPNNELPGAAFYWLGLAQTGLAIALFYGGLTRVAAALLAAVWLLGIFLVGLEPMLENLHYLGFALFFFLAGRGPMSIDRLLFPVLEPDASLMDRAMPCLRTLVGLSLVAVAFTEKLMNLALAEAFLQVHPLNFTAYLGIPMSDRIFVTCAGAVELLVGLWIALGIFPRPIILIAWLPFNITLTVFDAVELVGHLPYYGFLAVMLIWTPLPDDRKLWVQGLRGELPHP